ncbi:diaminobutyrate acetyltransferase [Leisingera daeponensis]|uniref:L-2,4-diaminobutyric acid acetyltransferase n=1 Tax=Leisingera daeponensis TaxID=405746 RepID=A0ABS7NH00_9RHOB|nr:diaminobutyrate acetyltransferase [Leisingera daeponensis]MBY6140472.1 diaminobutyrate acetyltransferase [Leisingera daeponensis]
MRHALELFRKAAPALREPTADDGPEIWELVRACKPLDENSMYCNLIQCDHFRDTCVVAEIDGKIAGWVSAYVLPGDPETLFVWQVAVSEKARGTGLGSLMLTGLLRRKACEKVKRLQTTITQENRASWALFNKFAANRSAPLNSQPYYTQGQHFRDRQSTEHMVTIDFSEAPSWAA